MSGRWVRRVDPAVEHRCDLPEHARVSDVWQCDCGRRYTCLDHYTRRGGMVTTEADWQRRYWPWPRLDPAIPSSLVGVEIVDDEVVDLLLNGDRTRGGARDVRRSR